MRSAETAPASAGVQPSGYRKITPEMFLAYEKAKDYVGAQEGTGNPMIYLRAFQEAAPYLDLPSHAYQFVSMLVLTTQRQDWEAGSCPKSWLSQDYVCKVLGLGKSRVKALTRRLVEAKIFTMDDDAQGRRWGRRNEGGQIIEAHGFDLRLLAVRHQEFVEIAAAERRKRATMATLRERVRKGRRWIRQVSETLETLGLVPLGWSGLLPAVGALTTAPRDLAMVGSLLDQTLATVAQVERSIKLRVTSEAERDPSKREWLAQWGARIAEVRGLIASAGATGNEERAGRVFRSSQRRACRGLCA